MIRNTLIKIGGGDRQSEEESLKRLLLGYLRFATLFFIIFVRQNDFPLEDRNRWRMRTSRTVFESHAKNGPLCKSKRVYYIAITMSKGGHQRDNLRMKIARSRDTERPGALLGRTRNLILKDNRDNRIPGWQ